MCSITGFITFSNTFDVKDVINSMNNQLTHRGPDQSNIWINKENNLALGHNRLSIIDLSDNGSQPMHSYSKRYTIIFNGEIYNFLDLKKKLDYSFGDIEWNSKTDTEVLINLIDKFGLENALSKITGMFAFALWDKKEENLYLVRDRVGEKPLYYGYINNSLIFASELKSLTKFPNFNFELDQNSIHEFYNNGYINHPRSIYKNINKLNPGHFLKFNKKNQSYKIKRYWKLENFNASINKYNYMSVVDETDRLLKNSIRNQLISDVPVGVFLSGGLDSSLLTSIMSNISTNKIKTFTIGFEEKNIDYSEHLKSRKIARKLNTEHSELIISGKNVAEIIPMLPNMYCEPFADCSQIPTFLVSKITKKSVGVAISGDGGDEIFGGYNRYIYSHKYMNILKKIPNNLKILLKNIILKIKPKTHNDLAKILFFFINNKNKLLNFSDKIYKIANVIDSKNINDFYNRITSNILFENKIFLNNNLVFSKNINESFDTSSMMLQDFNTYLPNDILCKVDRASMSVGLETRAPYLDHKLIEFIHTLPLKFKIKNNRGKVLLRTLLGKYLPKELIDGPKTGFGIPIDLWLKNELKEWAEDTIYSDNLKNNEFINQKEVINLWKSHLSGTRNFQNFLWSVLVFEDWYKKAKN